MRTLEEIKDKLKECNGNVIKGSIDGMACGLSINGKKAKPILCIASWGDGWDHVSASFKNRTPSWDEMCVVKDVFFKDEEQAVQYHPKKSEHINVHDHCLHLWRKHGEEIPKPPMAHV